ncbi:MAG: peptidylprolyl isomerase [Archangium sp.]
MTSGNLVSLARQGYFRGLTFHRVVPDFVAQGGDPHGDGEGGPGYSIRCEMTRRPYRRGTLGMALSGKDTGGSQFFFTHSPQPHLDGRYTAFGEVTRGMEVVDRLLEGDTLLDVEVLP